MLYLKLRFFIDVDAYNLDLVYVYAIFYCIVSVNGCRYVNNRRLRYAHWLLGHSITATRSDQWINAHWW